MTPEMLAVVAGILLSLAASYVPRFNEWFAALEANQKRSFMLGMTALAALAAFGLSCAGMGDVLGAQVTCDQAGGMTAVRAFLAAIVANQTAFLAIPKPVQGEK